MTNDIAANRLLEFFNRERWAALLLPDGWRGGPMGTLHQLSDVDFHDDSLNLYLDRVQELRFWGNVTATVTPTRLILSDYTRVQLDWPPRRSHDLGLRLDYRDGDVEFVNYPALQSQHVQPPVLAKDDLISLVHTCGEFDEAGWEALEDLIRAGEGQVALENWIGQLYEFELRVDTVPWEKLRAALRQFGVNEHYFGMLQELLAETSRSEP